jgi:7-keto-8-aminopelargonate synthetase-like enzyme
MKVVLKVTVIDRLIEEFAKAARNNREVDYVVISERESREMHQDWRYFDYVQSPRFGLRNGEAVDAKATFRCLEFEYTGPKNMRGTQYQYRRFGESFHTFMGVPIFVVHEDYMPR